MNFNHFTRYEIFYSKYSGLTNCYILNIIKEMAFIQWEEKELASQKTLFCDIFFE